MARKKKILPIITQRPVKGGRAQLPSLVLEELYAEIDRTAKRFNVSRSFVVAVALGDQFGIEVESYRERFDKRTLSWRKPLVIAGGQRWLKKA